jgi:phosphatidylserine decarboxylase
MDKIEKIFYRDRRSRKIITEAIFQEKILRWLYETSLGNLVFRVLLNHRIFHILYGKYQNLPYSRWKIPKFIDRYGLNTAELALSIEQYSNFNAFFSRQLKPSARPFIQGEHIFCAPGDGKLLVYSILNAKTQFQVKGQSLSLESLLAASMNTDIYSNGTAMVLRLAPADYHRFHFPDSGIARSTRYINGDYHSVNPLALAKVPDVYCRNQRAITQFESDHFGKIVYIEVGALTISSIIQTYHPGHVIRGQEKGYFQYGGSTIILLFQPGKIVFDNDLVEDSAQNLEVQVLAGSRLGSKPQPFFVN